MTMRVRTVVFWLGAVVILAAFQLMVMDKERILVSGQDILLELAPVDPRSLMQGDYMRLGYQEDGAARVAVEHMAEMAPRGLLVAARGEGKAATILRVYDGSPVAAGECLIRYDLGGYGARSIIRPDTFFFQEGHAAAYEAAQYGVFRCLGDTPALLVGLADKTGTLITPPAQAQ